MEAKLNIRPELPGHMYLLNMLLNGFIGTDAQTAAVVRIVQQLRRSQPRTEAAMRYMETFTNEFTMERRHQLFNLDQELAIARFSRQTMSRKRAAERKEQVETDPVEVYCSAPQPIPEDQDAY